VRLSRPRAGLAVVVAVVGWLVLMAGPPAASAHPLGNFTVNRYAGIVVSPGRVEIRYVVDMAEIPTFQEQSSIDADGDGTDSPLERQAWADRTARTVASKLTVAVDGSEIDLSVSSDDLLFRDGQAGLPILYFTASFSGALGSSSGSVSYSDGAYEGRIGWKEVTVRSVGGASVFGSSVPAASVSRELTAYPQDLLSSPLDVTSATFSFRPGPGTGGAMADRSDGPTVSGAPISSGGAFAGLVRWKLTPVVLVASLLLALAFGAVHALGPGHGKTITAAYLVGSGARVGQAIAVGSAVALMHTASVLVLGLVVFVLARSFPAEHIYPWLTLGTGVVALSLGVGLFVSRWQERRRGSESHQHSHVHPHPHPHRLAALAVSGGLLPSPTAFVVLTGAINAHRIGYGLSLILAFSVGLAAALIGVGLLALRARSVVATHFRSRWAALIPLGSALVIVGFGVFFAARGLTQVG
jgi:nickel/cobalt transporter (NicO) family protein